MRFRTAILFLICCTQLSGCNVVGVLGHAIGNPDTEAQYILPKKPTVVIVSDLPDPTGQRIESEALAAEIDNQLQMHDLVPVVSSSKVADLRSTSGAELSPAKIALAADAEQVIYVRITVSTLDAGPVNDVVKGQLDAVVSVINARTGEALWPTDGSLGTPVSCETPMMTTGNGVNRSLVRSQMYVQLADGIAKLFYKYKNEK